MDNYRVAVASSDGIVVNQHFGHADTFYIYEVSAEGAYRLTQTRNVSPVCHAGDHDDERLAENIDRFRDCKYILVSRIGPGAANALERSGIVPMELPGVIGASLDKLVAYEQVQNLY